MKYALLKFIHHSALTLNLTIFAIILAASIIVPIILRLMHKGSGNFRKGCICWGVILAFIFSTVFITSPDVTILDDLKRFGFLLLGVMVPVVIVLIIFGAVKFFKWLEEP